ncbi:MAG: efflux RND transporter permease subunit [Bacteroidales bacterium]|nr:efflux RND transporter permease subunit [Lentimicrobiaceae bacterium]MDD5696151.1 efflux RND transporter permease subunit [Bacteroidales bacterium]
MSLSSVSINRPILPIVFAIILIIFGTVSFFMLGDREYPDVEPPIVNVSTIYVGANAEIIQTQITDPLEEAISGIEGVRVISSQSTEQSSLITVEFNIGEDLERAANDVRDKVAKTIRFLPKDIDPPIVEKLDVNANPIIFMTVKSESRDLLQVYDIVDRLIKDRLQTIPEIGGIQIFGDKKYCMRLWMDPDRLAAHDLTPLDVQQAVVRENVELPSGRIEGENSELSVRTLGLLTTPDEFNNLTIREKDGSVLRFSDLGFAELGAENERTIFKSDLFPCVAIGVIPQPGANTIDIADEFYKRMDEVREVLPPDIDMRLGFDFTLFERNAIKEVKETMLLAFCLVVLIIYFFLRDWRSAVIPVVAIPISIIATFFIMYLTGITINVLTLVGLILAIGLVCDDAIIVLEIIYTKVDSGFSAIEAAHKGIQEIQFAIISTTLTLAVVFIPIMFLQGLTGKLFREFALVVAGSVMVSGFVALTLSPMMGSRILTQQRHLNLNWFFKLTEPFFLNLNRRYRYSLAAFIKYRWVIWPVFALIAVLIFLLGSDIHSELAPYEDRSNVRIITLGPEGSSYEFMEKYMDQLSQYVADSIPEATRNFAMIAPSFSTIDAPNKGQEIVYLSDPDKRDRTQNEIFQKVSRDLQHITGISAFPFEPPTVGSRFAGQALQFVIQSASFDSLKRVLPLFLEEARKSPILSFVDANLKINKPELRLTIDRDRAAIMGISVRDIATTLQFALSGQRFDYFYMNGKQYQVIGQVTREYRDSPEDLKLLNIRNNRGELIPLENFILWEEGINPSTIFTYDRYISATISAGTVPGMTLGDGISEMYRIAAKVLPANFRTALAGQARDYAESSASLRYIFMLALVLIYLILAAQFNSWLDPLVILMTVPLALFGALLSLWFFDQTLNIFSQIGIIMLIGLVTKNGILIVEFANQRKLKGINKFEAVRHAAATRLRPILMTASATILGILPIALSIGASSGSRRSMGIAVVGGMLFATFFSLYIVPALYTYLSKENIKTSSS